MGKNGAAKENKSAGVPATKVAGLPSNVIELKVNCSVEDCKKRGERASFCSEHFDWFKAGLVTKEGRKPRDFDRKYMNYLHRKKVA